MAGGDPEPRRAGHRAHQRQAVARDRAVAGLAGQHRRAGDLRGEDADHPQQGLGRAGIGRHLGGILGQWLLAGEAADIGGAVRPRKDLGRVHAARQLHLDEQRLGTDAAAGVQHHAVALEAVDHRQAQRPAQGAGPRAHGQHHGIGRQPLTVDDHAGGDAVAQRDVVDTAGAQPGTGFDRGLHHAAGEQSRVDLRRRRLAAEPALQGRLRPEPARPAALAAQPAAVAGGDAERLHPPIAPVGEAHRRQLGMQREAAAGQRTQRRAVAPVERQEAAGLARGGAGDAAALDHHHLGTAAGQEPGDAGADHPAAADRHPHQPSAPARFRKPRLSGLCAFKAKRSLAKPVASSRMPPRMAASVIVQSMMSRWAWLPPCW